MTALVVWVGPVSASNLGAIPAGAKLATLNTGIGGIGSSHFRALALASPSPVAAAAAKAGLAWDDVDKVILLAFSAGHGWLDVALANPLVRARLALVGACDAYFTNASKARKPGYAAAAADAIAGSFPFVMTSSPVVGALPDGTPIPSGNEAVEAFVAPLSLDVRGVPTWAPPGAIDSHGRGLFQWIRYDGGTGVKDAHVKHATRVAPALLHALGGPLLGAPPGVGPTDDAGPMLLAAGLLGLLAVQQSGGRS